MTLGSAPLSAEGRRLLDVARELIEEGTPANTQRAYAGDLARFCTWCEQLGVEAMPAAPETVVLYITHLADVGRKPSTIDRAVAGIVAGHKIAGLPSPRDGRVSAMLGKIARARAAPRSVAAPLSVRGLRECLVALGKSSLAPSIRKRDAAVLLLGWSAALRRSELSDLDLSDVSAEERGIRLHIRRSKGDPTAEGAVVPVAPGSADSDPVDALRDWLSVRGGEPGPLFYRSYHDDLLIDRALPGWQVDAIVRRAVRLAWLEPDDPQQRYSAHSLRAGLITEAARAGARDWQIMRHSRHRSHEMISRYVRIADPFEGNPQAGLL